MTLGPIGFHYHMELESAKKKREPFLKGVDR